MTIRILSGVVTRLMDAQRVLTISQPGRASGVIYARELDMLAPHAEIGDTITITVAVTPPKPLEAAKPKPDLRGAPSRPGGTA